MAGRRFRRAGPSPSIDLALLVAPVGLAQLALEDLAGRVARQCVDEADRLGQLVACDALARPGDQFAGVELDAHRTLSSVLLACDQRRAGGGIVRRFWGDFKSLIA